MLPGPHVEDAVPMLVEFMRLRFYRAARFS